MGTLDEDLRAFMIIRLNERNSGTNQELLYLDVGRRTVQRNIFL